MCVCDQVENVLNLIWSEFKSNLANNVWMDEATKQIAIDKAQSVLHKVGYPEFITDVDKLDDYYAQVYITK